MKTIALISHPRWADKMIEWAKKNEESLKEFNVITTGDIRLEHFMRIPITTIKPFHECGDLRIASQILTGSIDALVLFWDWNSGSWYDEEGSSKNAHVSILRAAFEENIPIALNATTADLLISEKPEPDVEEQVVSPLQHEISSVLDSFVEENKTIVEKYQSGFKSMLNVMSDKIVSYLNGGANIDKEDIKQVLENLLGKEKDVTVSQVSEIETMMVNILGRESYLKAILKHLDGDVSAVETISGAIRKVKKDVGKDRIIEVVKNKLESYKDNREDVEKALKAYETEEEISEDE